MIRLVADPEKLRLECHLEGDLRADPSRALEALSLLDGPLRPDRILGGSGENPYEPEAAVAEWRSSKEREVWLAGGEPPMSWTWSISGRGKKAMTSLFAKVPVIHLEKASMIDALATFMLGLARLQPPLHGYVHHQWDFELGDRPYGEEPHPPPVELVEMYWLNLFGPELVKKIGLDTVRSTPAHRVEILDNGSALVLTTPDPRDYYFDASCDARARALHHLRPDLALPKILKKLRARAKVLAPVERDWDPDLVPLLEFTLTTESWETRRERERAYNRLRSEVTEWAERSGAPAPEIDGAEHEREIGKAAEDLVVVVHRDLDLSISDEPEFLGHLDAFFYTYAHRYFDTTAHVDQLVAPIGAFLGRMLVRELGGEWIPRRALEESAVLLGDRVWFPFQRARHYAGPREKVLESSLLKFFRVAERSVRGG